MSRSRNKNNSPKTPNKDSNGIPKPKGDRIVFQTDGAGPVGTLEFIEGRFNFTGAMTDCATKFFGFLKAGFIDPYVRKRLGITRDVSGLQYHIFGDRKVCAGCDKKSEGISFRITSPREKKSVHHACNDCLLKAILGMEDSDV